MKRWAPFAVAALTVTACQDASGPARQQTFSPRAPVFSRADGIPDRYVVVLKDAGATAQNQGDVEQEMVGGNGGTLIFSYRHALNGFAARLSAAAVSRLAQDPRVKYIEQDALAHAISTGTQTTPKPTWGIDRIDQAALPLSGSYTWNASGVGVTAYIIDTGIRFDHSEFGGRAVKGEDEITIGGTAADCNGHGTHVSGTIGGKTYGVARDVKLVAVRVLDCSGSGAYSAVIAGVNFVTGQKNTLGGPMVANMSLGGGPFQALDDAITKSTDAGVTYAVAAGNDGLNACNYSPARTPSAITVGATDNTDTRTSWSNYGTCVDIFAPGNGITSSWYTTATATNTISGTSMASPHVAGAAALYLETDPYAKASVVAAALISNATKAAVKSPGTGSPNLLLYTGFIAATPVYAIAVTPATATVLRGGTQQFTASGVDAAGKPVAITPTWSVSGGGTISSSGLFTATTTGTNFTVTATSGSVSGTAIVTVNEPLPGALATITVTPSSLSVFVGGQQQFTATGKDANGTVVAVTPTWSVSTNGGAITVDGLFSAGTLAGTYTVTASNGSVKGTATVTVKAGALATIAVTPNPANVAARATQTFTAVGRDGYNNIVSFAPAWSVTGGGSINATSGVFTAGTVAGTWSVKATSGAIFKTAVVNVTAAVACTNGNCQN
ncbi:MAG: S8 family serine peptidase [Gemmatimonadota bacterium]|nr:S8 family serine peptidase [Gemmatimonadota bacterium]